MYYYIAPCLPLGNRPAPRAVFFHPHRQRPAAGEAKIPHPLHCVLCTCGVQYLSIIPHDFLYLPFLFFCLAIAGDAFLRDHQG
ncbi:MAG: hypothetical protein ACYC9M_15905 [Desulfobulbaceae bacterium]